MPSISPIAGLFLLCCAASFAVGVSGADGPIKSASGKQAVPDPDVSRPDPFADLRQKLAEFRRDADTLAPEPAAERWLALLDSVARLPPRPKANSSLDGFGYDPDDPRNQFFTASVFAELPPTADWDALARALEARAGDSRELRLLTLRVLAATFRGDLAGQKKGLEELRKALAAARLDGDVRQTCDQNVETIIEALTMRNGNQADPVALFEEELAQRESKSGNSRYPDAIAVPDLVALAGPQKAEALLRRALALGRKLQVQGEGTRQLLVTMVLQSIDKLKTPPWSLVRGPDDAALYEVLAKRFSAHSFDAGQERHEADAVYLVSLIAQHRAGEAMDFVAKTRQQFAVAGSLFTDELREKVVREGLMRPVRDFLRDALAKDPTLPFWRDDLQLSARLGEGESVLAGLRATAARANLSPEVRDEIDEYTLEALLAADQVEEGLSLLRAVIQKGPRAGKRTAHDEAELSQVTSERMGFHMANEYVPGLRAGFGGAGLMRTGLLDHVRRCLQLAWLGHLLDQPATLNEGLDAAVVALRKAGLDDVEYRYALEGVVRLLATFGRGPEAGQLVVDEMAQAVKRHADFLPELVEKQAAIYHLMGRHDEVLRLLDTSLDWASPHLTFYSMAHSLFVPVLFAAAQGLAAGGKEDEARRALDRLLEFQANYDPAYALLLELGGADLEAHLDALAQRDRLEKRPLIWKAKLQFDAGQVGEAEKTVRAAIAIDPSDGVENEGDGLRADAVLADVLEKKGDLAEAKERREMVAAMRLAEMGDELWWAGLRRRAVARWEEALGHFADSYGIHLRLAQRYPELGDDAKADQHYRRALELMPGSIGSSTGSIRGCQVGFPGARVQDLADRVFAELAGQAPVKPQVFYLLGCLRQQQGRTAEAAAQFREAVKRDPDYFAAWNRLCALPKNAAVPQEDLDAGSVAMLRLDPRLRHHYWDFDKVANLRALWDAVLAAEKVRLLLPGGHLYTLAATEEKLQRRREAALQAAHDAGRRRAFPQTEVTEEFANRQLDAQHDVRTRFAGHPVVASLAALLDRLPPGN